MNLNRSPEDVDNLLELAKLDKDELLPLAQSLYYGKDIDLENIVLMELDSNVLNCIENGKSLTIRGLDTDCAVLCTDLETYDIKEAETSNTLLLFRDFTSADDMKATNQVDRLSNIVSRQGRMYINNNSMAFKDVWLSCSECLKKSLNQNLQRHTAMNLNEVLSVKHNYLELKLTKPRLKRLQEKLEEDPYIGNESENSEHRYSFEDLLNQIQASREELMRGLKSINACLINGFWRLLDFDFFCSVFTSLLAVTDEKSWSHDNISKSELEQSLEELYTRDVVNHVIEQFVEPTESSPGVYRLKENTVCRLYAEMILRTAVKFHLQEFEETWQLAVPDGMKTDFSQLQGLAIVDRDSKPEIIRYFPVTELPENVESRFQLLFKTREKWTLEEITPYIEGLCSDTLGVGALLTKYARVSTQKGTRTYSTKKL